MEQGHHEQWAVSVNVDKPSLQLCRKGSTLLLKVLVAHLVNISIGWISYELRTLFPVATINNQAVEFRVYRVLTISFVNEIPQLVVRATGVLLRVRLNLPLGAVVETLTSRTNPFSRLWMK